MKLPFYMAGPSITEHEIKIVEDAMRNGWYGEKTYYYCEAFEKAFADWHGRQYALMTPNCTSAIHLALYGLGIGQEDEVIVPECTWVATASPIKLIGATPVFVDIDPEHWCIAPSSVEKAITRKTKAVIAVDLYGNMPNMEALQSICGHHHIPLLEDAAEALGSTYKNIRAGKFGLVSFFSFHRTKTLTTGEGGMLLLDDDKLFERLKFLRDHGRSHTIAYWAEEATVKYMPFNLQAALGLAQFQRIEELVGKKHWILEQYRKHLNSPLLQLNAEPEHVYNGAWSATVVWDKSYKKTKKEVISAIEKDGYPARPFFYPLSQQPAFSKGRENNRFDNPVAYELSDRGINLPSALTICEQEIALYSQVFLRALK
ncbi:MAG: DegT/DnrJ/EryC1/StrS family aminotransferase [Gammaproteobacteria bacterium]|nr:DegT/DnrJ/EryC1/StrS family aminotransferase [Gammaproteobacteria bacterium]